MAQRPKTTRAAAQRQFRKLYIGEWIRALGMRQVDVVRATGINEGYLSSLISGGKKNPSFEMLNQIADFLGIPISYFNRPPPDREFLAEASGLDPRVLQRLMTRH
ncbi:helix-turn-helix domain-containing protein [Bradyrhizobium oligotrophicum S58]